MSLLTVIIVLVAVGLILWAINTYIPLEPWVKKMLNIVVVIILVIWLLKALGIWGQIERVHVEHFPTINQKSNQ